MFGLSRKKNEKIAYEITQAVMMPIRQSLYGSQYMHASGNITYPNSFWTDSYIVSFVFGLMSLFLQKLYSGNRISNNDKGKILTKAARSVCQDGFDDYMQILNSNMPKPKNLQSLDFVAGANDGATLFGAAFGILKDNDPDSTLTQARELAKNIPTPQQLGVTTEWSFKNQDDDRLFCAVSELTIQKRVAEKFLTNQAGIETKILDALHDLAPTIDHIEQVEAWLEENQTVCEAAKELKISDINVNWDKWRGTFKLTIDGAVFDKEFTFNCITVTGKAEIYTPMFVSPMGAPASYVAIKLPDEAMNRIEQAIIHIMPKLKPLGLDKRTGEVRTMQTPINDRLPPENEIQAAQDILSQDHFGITLAFDG